MKTEEKIKFFIVRTSVSAQKPKENFDLLFSLLYEITHHKLYVYDHFTIKRDVNIHDINMWRKLDLKVPFIFQFPGKNT